LLIQPINDIAKIEEKHLIGSYGFIYITTNKINGKRYIGQKKYDNASRWKSYLGSGFHLMNAIKHYGKENFFREIIDIAYSEEELNKKEEMWIKKYNAVNDNNFYNMIEGGNVQESLKRKNSIPVICICNNFVFKSIADASLWSGYNLLTIKNTYKKKHNLNNKNERLIFRPLTYVKEKCNLCCVCGKNFIKRSNAQKKCDKCSCLKGKLIINHDFEKSDSTGVKIYKITDGWVKRKIELNDKICKDCGLSFEKTKQRQRRCIECQKKRDKENARLRKQKQRKLNKYKE
jgi:hypothetical protein